MSETPEQYRKRREGLHKAEEHRAERLRSLSDEDLLNEADTLLKENEELHKENDTMSQLLKRLSNLYNTDPFDGAHALLDARELLHEREARLAKKNEDNK